MLPENNFYVASSQPDQGSTMSNSSAWGVVNNLLIVRSETVASCTASNPDGVVWVVDIVESRCSSDEYHDYQSSTEKILCSSGFLQQNAANPSRFYVLCPYFLATEKEVVKYVVSKLNELGNCHAQS